MRIIPYLHVLIASIYFLALPPTYGQDERPPLFKVNFYMMGMEQIDESITLDIGRNIDYLNEEFEGRILFEIGRLFMDINHAYIPELHKAATGRGAQDIDALVNDIEEPGSINVYLFNTYSESEDGRSMMGFTPVLSRKRHTYAFNSPRFDRIFISYPGLKDLSTLVHEMGHFLGLSHPWELNNMNKDMMGLNDEEVVRINHMTYNHEVSAFTREQLDRMHHFALTFRSYLLSLQSEAEENP